MSHLNFDETWMTPSPDRSGVKKKAAPGTSRVEKRRAKGQRVESPKGLARCAVVKVPLTKDLYEIRVKGTRQLVGTVRKCVDRGTSYSYKLIGDFKAHNGFPTQESAILRMLQKV